MDARYLLDANICSYLRQHQPVKIIERFEKLSPGAAGLPVVTLGELFYGAMKSQSRLERLKNLKELAQFLPVHLLQEAAGETYGNIEPSLRRRDKKSKTITSG